MARQRDQWAPCNGQRTDDKFSHRLHQAPYWSVIAPNQVNDMHHGKDPDGIQTADRWLQEHLDAYIQWAERHNSLRIVTWDEDNKKKNNRVVTLFVGPMVKAGHYDLRITHYQCVAHD